MDEKRNFYQVIEEICAKDQRYKADSYEFTMQALSFTQKKLGKEGHLSGKELLEGIREFTLEQYGPMAKTVLTHWGIKKTEDFGNIVFNMIEQRLLSKTESDRLEDFKDVYDFKNAFKHTVKDIAA
jgi:uncharacterized repeat protein (TIGR04138 family)